MTATAPVIFFGHGNPMNAIERNAYSEGWSAIGKALERPRAVLCVSAHWYLPGTHVTAMDSPRTIHDFGGFPRALHEVKYPAPGDPDLARRVRDLLAPTPVHLDERTWGLDHGTWSVLCHVFPDATVPVVQLSIDETQPAAYHYELAKRLAPLRDEGVLVVGSGNLIHNWAVRFEEGARALLEAGDHRPLVDYETLGRDALLSAPTPDHYLPLLYVCALQREGETPSFPVEGFDGGSVSMLTVCYGL
jgi:4,5-DOPA dioxygenase extradiol